MNEIIENRRKIEQVIDKNELLTEIAGSLRNEYALKDSAQLEKDIGTITEEGRLLKIGIIGRVKAGKSSLLNALFFEGQSILPKAATPMTAALSILTYSAKRGLEVDFFTEGDQNEIKRLAREYEDALGKKKDEIFNELKERAKKKKDALPDEELQQKAERRARSELDVSMQEKKAASEQCRMMGGRSAPSEQGRENFSDPESLRQSLQKLVATDGEFMPFTKSVTLYLPEKRLRDVEIIDTPGTNDPVISREQRTRDLLATCDVVFIVSPSGQFLSAEDLDLLDRIHTKEGVHELYLVASQVDSELFGSAKENGKGRLPDVLKAVRDNLVQHTQKTIRNWNVMGSEETKKRILALSKGRFFCTSAICYGLQKNLGAREAWDENEKYVWERLAKEYPEFFSDKDMATAKANLDLLTGITPINTAFSEVREKKDGIIKEKQEKYIQGEQKKAVDFCQDMQKSIATRIREIESTDVAALREEHQAMQKNLDRAKSKIDEKYLSLVDDLYIKLRTTIIEKCLQYFDKTSDTAESAQGTETKEEEVDKGIGFLWWRSITGTRYDTRWHKVQVINAGSIYRDLASLKIRVQETFKDEILTEQKKWREESAGGLVHMLREQMGDDDLDISRIQRTLREVFESIKTPPLELRDLPDNLKETGRLKAPKAEDYMQVLDKFLADFGVQVREDITAHIEIMGGGLKKLNCADEFMANFTEQIDQLAKEIENKEMTIEKYQCSLVEFKKVASI